MEKKAEAVEGASMAEAISSSARGVAATTTINKAMSMEEIMEVMKQIKEVQVDKGVNVNAAKAIAAAAADIRDDFLKIASAQESMEAADQEYERMNEPTTPTTRDSDDGSKMLQEKIKKLFVDAIVDAMPVIKMQFQRGPRVGDPCIKEQIMDARCGRATWSPEMKKMFIDLCLEQVKLGGRPGSNLKTSAWKKVREYFNQRNLVNYDQKQFKNYWDMLRKQWNTWKKLISLTGIGEVTPGQTVQMDQERWDEHIKAYPDAKQFRYKPLLHADEMEQLFGGVTATGKHKFSSADGDHLLDDFRNWPSTPHNPLPNTESPTLPPGPADQIDPDPVHVESEADYEDFMSSVRCKRLCPPKRRKDSCDTFVEKIDGVLDRIVNSATSQAPVGQSAIPTAAECYASLRQTPGIVLGTPLYINALRYINIPGNRELWMLEQDPESRVMLVQAHFSSSISSI